MDFATLISRLLLAAWLLPLASFTAIVFLGPRMGKGGRWAGHLATGAIFVSFLLSAIALGAWLCNHPLASQPHHAEGQAEAPAHASPSHAEPSAPAAPHDAEPVEPVQREWYALAQFGALKVVIGCYIDALTLAMFVMVTLVATCIHCYSLGYMHEELHEVTDPLVTLADGNTLTRRGRFHRFYQYLSLFCFSMLGLVIAGNVLMVFIFWELVGICSYFLIGFYIERQSATNAANKAFIVNRIGDFGMIVGLMALWGGLGTFAFGDTKAPDGRVLERGIFSLVRPNADVRAPVVPERMEQFVARSESEAMRRGAPDVQTADAEIAQRRPVWHEHGYWLLVVAGLGIFCGCVGKSAQFPLHVWLPDAMEGPTPVSALIHAATMVAAGVYLAGRFYPVFTPEVLLVIACIGCITLLIAATIAVTATDIKRVLAYSTVSQLGYMMLALGVGGWVAGLFHLFTHAFFKALLFLGSGSVIHACGTNEMPRMGGLRRKMPWTAYTMLVGCLAISGAGIPLSAAFNPGFSGYYSKDAMIAQLLSFKGANPLYGCLFYVATAGAALTAFYMFRLWYLTFAGAPRDKHVFDHAHESPKTMCAPLVVLAAFSVASGWSVWGTGLSLPSLLEQARPLGIAAGVSGGDLLHGLSMPAEYLSHEETIHVAASWTALAMALAGFLTATAFYGLRIMDAGAVRRQLSPIYWFLSNKWWFDEVYRFLFVRPALRISGWVAALDQRGIDWLADGLARGVCALSTFDDWIDRTFVDGLVNGTAEWVYGMADRLRAVQTGNLRQYVMRIVIGTVALFVLISLFWSYAAGS